MKRISRKTLALYAGMLGRDSTATRALRYYDLAKDCDEKPIAYIRNNGFAVSHVVTIAGKRVTQKFG